MSDSHFPRGDTDSKQEGSPPEWFSPVDPRTGDPGLRFSCTMCGNCCTGAEGYVLVTDAECEALAARQGIPVAEFIDRFTRILPQGRSLTERMSSVGMDCVFLDREKIPGKAVCGVYEDRPGQCRTWPFWPSVIKDMKTWQRHKQICPGMDKGRLVTIEEIRIQRDSFRI